MAKCTRNPWLEIQAMRDEIGKVMGENRDDSPGIYSTCERQAHFKPVADVYETTLAYVIQVELSGLERDAVNIEVSGNDVWIYGERRHEKDVTGGAYHVLERSYGPFARQFILPEGIDEDGIKAVMQKGILTITVPKKPRKSKGKRIEIVQE